LRYAENRWTICSIKLRKKMLLINRRMPSKAVFAVSAKRWKSDIRSVLETDRTQLIGIVIACVLVVSVSSYIFLLNTPPNEPQLEPPEGIHYNDVDIWFLKIMGFKLKYQDVVVYLDPAQFYIGDDDTLMETADFIVISHDHPTHCSPYLVRKLSDAHTIVIASQGPSELVDANYTVKPGDALTFDKVSFEFVASYCYNATLYQTETPMHTKAENNTGVIVDFEGTRIYQAGDTDRIPEMQSIQTDIAILPVSASPNHAWTNASEAAKVIDDLKISSDLKYAIPTHWDVGVGFSTPHREYAEAFAELANCTVIILDPHYTI
jgi:L-ascorbate metabolism protein UlaG (beta-lactamase superfamily)